MSSLFASRWAATPPPEPKPEPEQQLPPPPPPKDAVGDNQVEGKGNKKESGILENEKKVSDGQKQEETRQEPTNPEITPAQSPVNDTTSKSSESIDERALNSSTDVPAVDGTPDDAAEKPLPNLPSPKKSAATPPVKPETPQPAQTARLEPPRLKKRVSWRGKNIVVSIPRIDFESAGLFMPMSRAEIQERLEQFENSGYSTRGFDLAEDVQAGGEHVQAKPIYTFEVDRRKSIREQVTVLLPDLQKWKDYQDWLTEQKLAALGVTLGLDEPAPSQDMSRQSSNQYPPLPFSPPIPSASAASMGRPGMVRGHSHTMSVASPAPPMNGSYGHMHRNSVFAGSAFSGLQSFSPQPFSIPGMSNTGSPAPMSALRQELNGSPLSQQSMLDNAHSYGRSFLDNQRHQQQSFAQSSQMPPLPPTFTPQSSNARPTPALPQLPEDDDEEELEEESQSTYVPPQKRVQANTEIAVPTPRGHRHNISEGLERDVLQTESWRNEPSTKWSDILEGMEEQSSMAPPAKKQNANGVAVPPRFTPSTEKDPLGQNYIVQEAKHNRKKSGVPRFNVAAPSFTFNPGSAEFHPPQGAFTFGSAPMPKIDEKKSTGQTFSHHIRNHSSGSFNANAPAFKPSFFVPQSSEFTPQASSLTPTAATFPVQENSFAPLPSAVPSLPTSDFSFSAAVPTSNADTAPSSADATSDEAGIFGKVNIPEIVKPARRSKAIAIVHPEERKSNENSEFEDEEGRVAQGDQKRKQRKVNDDGDSVPQFAQPTEPSALPPPPIEKILGSNDQVLPAAEKQVENAPSEALDKAPEPVVSQDNSKQVEVKKQVPAHIHNRHSGSLSALAKPFEPVFLPEPEKVAKSHSEEQFSSLSDLEEGEIHDDDENDVSPVRQPPVLQPSNVETEAPKAGEPSFDEIDAVMRQLNGDEANENVNDRASPVRLPSPGSHPMKGVTYIPEWSRSDAPSPSPRRRIPESAFNMHPREDSIDRDVNGWSQVTRLNKAEDAPMSDWSGILSPPDEAKLPERSKFFDSHIDKIVGRVIEQRLRPLEESLRTIHNSVARRNRSSDNTYNRASSNVDSDADDEDDLSDGHKKRPISRGRDKRLDQIKAVVAEALRDQSPKRTQMSNEVAELHSVLADMKVSFARAASANVEIEEIRHVVEDALTRQSQAVVPVDQDQLEKEDHKREMIDMEARLNTTLANALEEANLRRTVEERESETRRLLRLAEEEMALLRNNDRDNLSKILIMEEERTEMLARLEKSEETLQSFRESQENKIQDMQEERHDLLERLEKSQHDLQSFQEAARADNPRVLSLEVEREELLERISEAEDTQQSTQEKLKDAESENEALQATLAEYRTSSNKWRQEIEHGKRERETLEHEISILERQAEDNQESSTSMKRRLEKIHADMATATGQLASEKAMWKAREEHFRARYDALEAQQAVFAKERNQLEEDLSAARVGAAEATEYRKTVEQMRSSNNALDEAIRKLRAELTEQQALAARFERQFHDAQDAARAEVHRTRMSMETDIEAANHQVNIVRAELESELTRVRAELETVKLESDSARATHEHLLEQEENARREALRKVNHANSVALDEARHKYETSIHEMTSQHNRSMQHVREDKERSELFLNERLTLSDAKLQHFQDRVDHLEEKLKVAKSAAQAAALSAKSTKTVAGPTASSGLPEKISPQALRESILVLQEQLQERETRIERLQQEVDEEGPAKLKERDTEIAWLRELLSVRGEELGDLVKTLSAPSFNREAVRDTAIRIRANLQMEQQEKERLSSRGPQSVGEQALASISSFASPRAAQFTSAFNKWRSNMESSTLKTNNTRPGPASSSRSFTPSKAPAAPRPPMFSSYSSGLMTPPASNLRNSPTPDALTSLPPPQLHPRTGSQSSRLSQSSLRRKASSGRPTTPLLRDQAYDEDASEDHHGVQMRAFEDDDDLNVADSQPPAFRSLEDELLEGGGSDDADAEE